MDSKTTNVAHQVTLYAFFSLHHYAITKSNFLSSSVWFRQTTDSDGIPSLIDPVVIGMLVIFNNILLDDLWLYRQPPNTEEGTKIKNVGHKPRKRTGHSQTDNATCEGFEQVL